MSALHDLPAHALLSAYRQRTLSPVEVVRDVLAHVERWEPHINATYLLRPEAALAQAAASQARWLRGEPLGALDGVPTTIKENIATRGDPMPLGTAATALVPTAADAPPAARLREAGAVIVAKSTMPDYGMLSSGLSSFHALARNPWDLSKGPGGSSAGAGAAAAAGYGPLHIGTDIGGSLRLPASWCGIFSLKPSLGRIPIDPPYTGRAAGPMTRTVADAALMMQVLSQGDARDSMALPAQDIAWGQFDQGVGHLRGLRIGLLLDAGCGLGHGLQALRMLWPQAELHGVEWSPLLAWAAAWRHRRARRRRARTRRHPRGPARLVGPAPGAAGCRARWRPHRGQQRGHGRGARGACAPGRWPGRQPLAHGAGDLDVPRRPLGARAAQRDHHGAGPRPRPAAHRPVLGRGAARAAVGVRLTGQAQRGASAPCPQPKNCSTSPRLARASLKPSWMSSRVKADSNSR